MHSAVLTPRDLTILCHMPLLASCAITVKGKGKIKAVIDGCPVIIFFQSAKVGWLDFKEGMQQKQLFFPFSDSGYSAMLHMYIRMYKDQK